MASMKNMESGNAGQVMCNGTVSAAATTLAL
jgi:hypothetical protein